MACNKKVDADSAVAHIGRCGDKDSLQIESKAVGGIDGSAMQIPNE